MAELKHSARLGKTFLVGWLRKAENKTKAPYSSGLTIAEIGNTKNIFEYESMNIDKCSTDIEIFIPIPGWSGILV